MRNRVFAATLLVCAAAMSPPVGSYFATLASAAPANTSITHWHLEPEHRLSKRPTWILHTFNDAFHLRDIASPERINWSAAAFREPKELTQPEFPERAAAAVPAQDEGG